MDLLLITTINQNITDRNCIRNFQSHALNISVRRGFYVGNTLLNCNLKQSGNLKLSFLCSYTTCEEL